MVPDPHATHVALLVAPCAFDAVPAGQGWQVPAVLAAVVPEYVPTPHATQSDTAVAPVAARYVPAAHDSQTDTPVAPENVPAAHGVHAPAVVAAHRDDGMREQVHGAGAACLLVTHSAAAAQRADRVLRLTAQGIVAE